MVGYVIVALSFGMAGLLVGLTLDRKLPPEFPLSPGPWRSVKIESGDFGPITKQKIPNHPQAFRLRRSFKETRARWEDQHNQKAKRYASLAEQIRKAQEGTLQ